MSALARLQQLREDCVAAERSHLSAKLKLTYIDGQHSMWKNLAKSLVQRTARLERETVQLKKEKKKQGQAFKILKQRCEAPPPAGLGIADLQKAETYPRECLDCIEVLKEKLEDLEKKAGRLTDEDMEGGERWWNMNKDRCAQMVELADEMIEDLELKANVNVRNKDCVAQVGQAGATEGAREAERG